MSERFVIGIDLGTTNSSLAYIDLNDEQTTAPKLLPLAQWENDDQTIEAVRLPSFLWMLPKNILKKGLRPHPAFAQHLTPFVIGRWAREKALTDPLQVIHSAKSWLSSGGADHRLAKILPWGSTGDKLSPLEAESAILSHIKQTWDVNFPSSPLSEQIVIITVPASFDELAQRLTLEAAKLAGYSARIELLEEPLAAYYDWEAQHDAIRGRILVADVGGGTSDFTLLERSDEGTERMKVSEHLLLGGDNIDLALTFRLSALLSPEELPRAAWNLLLAQTRRLKEDALNSADDEEFHLSLPLDPTQLFGTYLSATVNAAQIRTWVLHDFFPKAHKTDRPERAAGLQSWGLPYAKDTAITRHLAEFLEGIAVDHILCVGGTLLPKILRERLVETVASWQSRPLSPLTIKDPDLAIAYGAARFGERRARARSLVNSPYPRQLSIEVEDKNGARSVTLIPKGHPRMTAYEVKIPGLYLRLGRDVRFQIAAHSADEASHALPPLVLRLPASQKKELIPVRLEASVRETGVLEVSCHALEGDAQWTLDFAIEGSRSNALELGKTLNPDIPQLDDARKLIKQFFARQSTFRIDTLPTALEELLKTPRDKWSADILRGLWPALESVMFQRAVTPEHETIWFYLAGLCLRPGFGYQGDDERISSLLRIYDESFRRVDTSNRLVTHWWILWRRLAGGLNQSFQQKIFDRYMPVLRKDKDASPELIRLLASLERVERSTKEQLGRLFLLQLKEGVKSNADTRLWGLARLASRYLVYGDSRSVLTPSTVEEWADELEGITLPPKVRPNLFYAWAGRMRGDKQYDIDPHYRVQFLSKVEQPEWRKALSEVVVPDNEVQSQMLADTLPSGFVFKNV
ncbi:MAG: Hsp70 family protein [Chitinophagaceae bacterium]|nr:Hsp70 family protein [Oligoflexus sp.]